ncbi:MAG: NUDIX domain-containing protein [Deltaproteobacteria bacterium]|nr:NUDIX domain-containing protein [Deltaproteobacteria bacterium]MBW2661150.1 NUDIX domain-containing protein [Deltaproteobacteria bacterium]
MQKKEFCHFCGKQLVEKKINGNTRLFCEHCKKPIYENPIPASCLIVIDDKEKVLLVKRNAEPKKGFWCLPGGFMELGETPEQAALRELKEETGLSGQIEMLLGVTSDNSSQYDTVLMVGYLIKKYSGILEAGDDASDTACFHPDELPEIAFESHKKFIRIYYAAYSKKVLSVRC